jgi:CRP/FNR family transcriptional regulator
MNTSTAHRDALSYLSRRALFPYPKGAIIYSGNCENVYLVTSGRVQLLSIAANGSETVIRIVPREGLFGMSALVGGWPSERAVALDDVDLMAWKAADIERQIEQEPALAMALIEEIVRTGTGLRDRMRAMATCKTPERVMLSLVQLAESLGKKQSDGAMQMPALTHRTIADHVGTSREIVSSQMNHLRRLGMVRYSRKQIEVYCDAMRDCLRNSGAAPRKERALTASAHQGLYGI